MEKILLLAAYAAYAVFWTRVFMHVVVWWRASRRTARLEAPEPRSGIRVLALTVLDVVFLGRVFMVNPFLWLGEWLFHASFVMVLLRHLRYFLNPVPGWVWAVQTPGLIAGYLLPFSLAYILVIRLLTKHEKYASAANMLLLVLVLGISVLGVLMHVYKPNLVDVKLFIFGIMTFSPASAPDSPLFTIHFLLVLVLVLLLPSHIFTSPLVMYEARKRGESLHGMMHEKEKIECRNQGSRFTDTKEFF